MAEYTARDSRPRSPMMTVSGVAAEGLSPNLFSGWIAAECVSPQLTAVLGLDTELQFAEIPVMRISILISVCKGIKKSLSPIILNLKFC